MPLTEAEELELKYTEVSSQNPLALPPIPKTNNRPQYLQGYPSETLALAWVQRCLLRKQQARFNAWQVAVYLRRRNISARHLGARRDLALEYAKKLECSVNITVHGGLCFWR